MPQSSGNVAARQRAPPPGCRWFSTVQSLSRVDRRRSLNQVALIDGVLGSGAAAVVEALVGLTDGADVRRAALGDRARA